MMAKEFSQFYWHEALDRAGLAAAHFEIDILEHPVVRHTPKLKRKAEEIADLLGHLYQEIGALYPDS